MYSQKNKNGFSLIEIVIAIIVVFIIANIIFSSCSIFRPMMWPGYYGHYYGTTYYGHRNYKGKYPAGGTVSPSPSKNSKFQERFSSKSKSSSFASRFSSKYGRSKVSGFRTSGFFGGK